jgi:hypothetical protein
MEFYAAMNKNKVLLFASKWMELENIILSEGSQAQKTKNGCFPSYVDFRSRVNTARGLIVLWSHDKAKAQKGAMRISKNPSKKSI